MTPDQYCQDKAAASGSSFYYSFLFLPADKRRAITALHGSGLIHVAMPWWATNTVMIAFGAVTGSRFANTPLRMLLHYLGAAFGSFAAALIITAIFAAGLVGSLLPATLAARMQPVEALRYE